MITGLYSASADCIPILCITGQAPRARLYKEDFQAVDIESIAKPVTKWAVTVREPALVPRVFQQAFHLMRSGRPGPVLIDLPFDVQMAEIEFDIDTYEPLPVVQARGHARAGREGARHAEGRRQAADRRRRRHHQRRRVARCCVEFAELTGVPVDPDADGLGHDPRRPSADGRHVSACRPATATATRRCSPADFVLGIGNRWANRHTGCVEVYTQGPQVRARRHRADADRPRVRRPTSASSATPGPRWNCSSRSRRERKAAGALEGLAATGPSAAPSASG